MGESSTPHPCSSSHSRTVAVTMGDTLRPSSAVAHLVLQLGKLSCSSGSWASDLRGSGLMGLAADDLLSAVPRGSPPNLARVWHGLRWNARWSTEWPFGVQKLSSPGLGMAVPVSQIDLGDLGSSRASVTGGRRWSPPSVLGQPRDNPELAAAPWSDRQASL
jgi:hypothetical protein